MATRSANIISGALLAADSGVMDPDIMTDPETPGDIMCVAPMSLFLGEHAAATPVRSPFATKSSNQ